MSREVTEEDGSIDFQAVLQAEREKQEAIILTSFLHCLLNSCTETGAHLIQAYWTFLFISSTVMTSGLGMLSLERMVTILKGKSV